MEFPKEIKKMNRLSLDDYWKCRYMPVFNMSKEASIALQNRCWLAHQTLKIIGRLMSDYPVDDFIFGRYDVNFLSRMGLDDIVGYIILPDSMNLKLTEETTFPEIAKDLIVSYLPFEYKPEILDELINSIEKQITYDWFTKTPVYLLQGETGKKFVETVENDIVPLVIKFIGQYFKPLIDECDIVAFNGNTYFACNVDVGMFNKGFATALKEQLGMTGRINVGTCSMVTTMNILNNKPGIVTVDGPDILPLNYIILLGSIRVLRIDDVWQLPANIIPYAIGMVYEALMENDRRISTTGYMIESEISDLCTDLTVTSAISNDKYEVFVSSYKNKKNKTRHLITAVGLRGESNEDK